MSDHIKSNTPSSSTRGGAPIIGSGINSTSRQLALERELAQLNRINSTIANLIQTIKFTNNNINKLNDASESTHTLLDQWIRILSQTNFTHDVINDKVWKGVTPKGDTEGIDGEDDDGDDDEEDDDFDDKLQLEQELLKQLQSFDAENDKLEQRIESKDYERSNQLNRDTDLNNKRRRELGLSQAGNNPRYRTVGTPAKRIRGAR
ncbi:DASH complex subunit Duo1-domain-containing protein [Scheffersomyces coipomensis]|uniref:DASH complex subunit Duo1-domain-containing protein n=1 Tax=Scheffersomyces coipomensis TaxID=1788519 RepID=UPI00315C70FA